MPDPHVVQRHLLAIAAHVAKLRRHVPITNESLQRNPDLLWVVERGLYLCIQNLLDCFAHIIAADFNEQWDTYAASSALLRRHGIITEAQEGLLKRMIGLRNRLSHEYMGLDTQILLDVVNSELSDVLQLANTIARYANLPLPGDT